MSIIETFKVVMEFQVEVDESTGKISTKCIKKSIDKTNFKTVEAKPRKSKKEESTTPQITLEENKLSLNSAAVELMSAVPDDKFDIKYEMIGKDLNPVIEKDSRTGNKLTKSFTIAYRGNKREELLKYGTVFELVSHGDGRFLLKGEMTPEKLEGDDNISMEDINDDLPLDMDILSLTDEKDANVFELDSKFFQL